MSIESFTGITRRRTTSRLVRFGDSAARTLITIGGVGTILAVAMVCAFLFWVVLPLLRGAEVEGVAAARLPAEPAALLHQGIDPYQQAAWQLFADGNLRAVAFATGKVFATAKVFDADATTAVTVHDDKLLLGHRDGSIEFVKLGFTAEVVDAAALPPLPELPTAALAQVHGDEIFSATGDEQFRRQRLSIRPQPPAPLADAAVQLLDFAESASGTVLVATTADRRLHLRAIREQENMMTGETEQVLSGGDCSLDQLSGAQRAQPPDRLAMMGTGNSVLLLWDDGQMLRVDTRDFEAPVTAESRDLLADQELRVTTFGFLIGKNTLLLGDSAGTVHALFLPVDGDALTEVRRFAGPPAAVTALAASPRSRLFVCGHANGVVRLLQGTSGSEVASVQMQTQQPVLAACIAPKEDGVLAADASGLQLWALAAGHPEVTLAALTQPVWYEGKARPEHVWQSTSGTDDFEPKYGLWPLLFGTLKATLYCLLLGVPLALLAAIYTSEFLRPRLRARIKPLLETMASLPSVVLGFLAALVFAPWIEASLLPVLSLAIGVPLLWLCGAQLFFALPPRLVAFADGWRLAGIAVLLPIGVLVSLCWLGPWLERTLFGGDLRQWLAAEQYAADDARRGSAFGGWLLLLLPLTATLTVLGLGLWRGLRRGSWSGCLRLLFGVGASVAASMLGAWLLTSGGFDLRGTAAAPGLVGTYVQRNALIVGIAMGFAVIPIIYTIAEDALTAVPEHLRAASLGAGATPWQTAVRIILPTAMSGIFSAIMVGLGRAIGETMIVLMAAGNTAILELNPFNGFRTLSANIATELPEAVRDSTHYRMLFLTAFVLFALTFLLNTMAEVVRQRFRKRAFQL